MRATARARAYRCGVTGLNSWCELGSTAARGEPASPGLGPVWPSADYRVILVVPSASGPSLCSRCTPPACICGLHAVVSRNVRISLVVLRTRQRQTSMSSGRSSYAFDALMRHPRDTIRMLRAKRANDEHWIIARLSSPSTVRKE